MKQLVKSLWIPFVTAIFTFAMITLLWIFPGVLIALFESSRILMYVWLILYLLNFAAAITTIIKTSMQMLVKYRVIYYIISFILLTAVYYFAYETGLYVRIWV